MEQVLKSIDLTGLGYIHYTEKTRNARTEKWNDAENGRQNMADQTGWRQKRYRPSTFLLILYSVLHFSVW